MQDEESRALLSSNVSASEWEKFEPEVEKPASDVRQDDHASSTAIGRRRRILIMAVAILTLLSLSLIGLDQVDTSQVKQQAAAHAGQLREDLQAWWGSVVASDNEQVRADKDEDYRQQDAQVEDLEDDEEQDVEDKPSEHSNVFDEFAPNDVIDTFPPFPADILASREDPSARYLAYIPHSGFHNQRGEFSNAATLATLLNRTLLVPHIRLGKPQPWKSKPFLEAAQVSEQKSNWIEQCRPYLPTLEDKNAKLDGPKECRNYHRYTEIDWPLMVNLDTMPSGASFLPRDDMSPHWFTAPVAEGGLGLSQEDIHDFDDPFRYTWQIYDDEKAPKLQDNYERRLDLSQLREPPYSDKRLLYFGSLFGGSRLQFRSPEANATAMKAYNALTFRNPLVDSIAIDITHKLGGRENYVGVHLRVGDGSFMRKAGANMRKAWTDLCEGVFGVPSETCFTLSEQNGNYQVDTQPSLHRHRSLSRRSLNENLQSPNTDISLDHFSMTDELQARDFASYQPSPLRKRQLLPFKARKGYANESQLPMSETLQCQGRLYTDPALTPLNRPVYIATDSHVPRQDRNLQVFFKSLPCAFVLGDFIHPTPYSSEPNSDLVHLLDVRTESDGVKLAPFLMAFLEAEVASRSLIATQGTEGSTFSSFATGTLHHAYAHDVDEEEWS